MATYGTQQEIVCSKPDCQRPVHKDRLCKHHFAHKIKQAFREAFKKMFRGPEQAYNNLDFAGIGYITEDNILDSPLIGTMKYSKTDL